jgi:SAM-dependent methyltransferase
MVIVSKARLISPREKPSLLPIARDIIEKARSSSEEIDSTDPLREWFVPNSAAALRRLETALQKLLIESCMHGLLAERQEFGFVSDLAAFFYTALFGTIRSILSSRTASNPTWIKLPRLHQNRLRTTDEKIFSTFMERATYMVDSISEDQNCEKPDSRIKLSVASSEAVPLATDSADLVLSSPPYCTRLDYAVASRPDLSLMGYSSAKFTELRKRLIGTTTVDDKVPEPDPAWGTTCNNFLKSVRSHPSKASITYYYKNHIQYFTAIWNSLAEIRRVLKKGGICIIVVQDSYYKDVHNDLAQVFVEMASFKSLSLIQRSDFRSRWTFAGINPVVRQYRTGFEAIESVLCLRK